MKNLLKKFVKDEQGLELSEYAIMAGIIIIIAIATILSMGSHINSIFTKVNTALNTADGG